jgi:hypothetical protein
MTVDEGDGSCNFLAPTVIEASDPVGPIPLGVMLMRCCRSALRQVQNVISPGVPADAAEPRPVPEIAPLNLEPGEWVEVRPIEEINETLDARQRYKGLYFMPAMEQYCGGHFRVFKKVKTIRLEDTGEVRQLKSPTVFLEDVYCDGKRHQGCDRACFHFWREAWLRRIPGQEAPREASISPGRT